MPTAQKFLEKTEREEQMQTTKKRTLLVATIAALALMLFAACSSGPKVINIGDSASRVTIQKAD